MGNNKKKRRGYEQKKTCANPDCNQSKIISSFRVGGEGDEYPVCNTCRFLHSNRGNVDEFTSNKTYLNRKLRINGVVAKPSKREVFRRNKLAGKPGE